tara:strand:+ start:2557 stop:2796 length:240 start_codon:yes stop_codon:yes gene_type:complete
MDRYSCEVCKTKFNNALYWFDSLYAANYKERIIKIFCGPKCVQEWYEANDAINFPLRKPPYPKGEKWKIIQDLDQLKLT